MGEKLRQLRRKKGLSQEAVAKELGISRQAVSKWETDIAQPDLDNLKKICEILEISADELLDISCTIHIKKERLFVLFAQ